MLRTTVNSAFHTERLLVWLWRPLWVVMLLVGSNEASHAATAAADAPVAAISITATPSPVKPGERVLYTITVSNRSANTVNRVDVTANVPDHTTVARSDSSFGSCNYQAICSPGATIFWPASNLAAGESQTFAFTALVDPTTASGTMLHSTATVAFIGPVSGGASAASDVTVNSAPPMLLGLVDSADPSVPGAPLSYTLTFTNTSGTASPATVLRMPLPAGTIFTSASDGGILVGNTVQWNIDALAPGTSGKRQLIVQVDPLLTNGSVVSATATLGSTTLDLARATAATVVSSAPVAAISMAATSDPVKPGERVLYTITVTNRAATLLSRVDVIAMVPDHTTVEQGNRSFGTCNYQAVCNPGATLFWNADVAVGQSQTFTFAALVDSATPAGTLLHSMAAVAFLGQASGGASAASDVAVVK